MSKNNGEESFLRTQTASRYFQGMATVLIAVVVLSVGMRFSDQRQADAQMQSTAMILSDREQSELQFRERTYDKLVAVLLNQRGNRLSIEQRIGILKLFMHNFHSIFNGRALFDLMEAEVRKETKGKPAQRAEYIRNLENLAKDVTRRQEESIGQASVGHRVSFGECTINVLGYEEGAGVSNGTSKVTESDGPSCHPVAITLDTDDPKKTQEVKARLTYLTKMPAGTCSAKGSSERQVENIKAFVRPCLCGKWPSGPEGKGKALACGDRENRISSRFTLNYYDSPFTDNTLLPGGHRFALTLKDLDMKNKWAFVNHFKFPSDFITAGHRPATLSGIDSILKGVAD